MAMAKAKRKHAVDAVDADDEMEQLMAELQTMAQTLMHHRKTLPQRLPTLLASHLAAQRPMDLPAALFPDPPEDDASLPQAYQHKLRILREKAQSNIAAMPHHLHALRQRIHKLHQIHQSTVSLHPVLQAHF